MSSNSLPVPEPTPEPTQTIHPQETTIREGVYLVANRAARSQLNLPDWSEGTPVNAGYYIESGGFTQQSWLISPTENQSFVIRNIGSGTVLDLASNGEAGKSLVCKNRVEGLARHEWKLEFIEDNFYAIHNSEIPEKVPEVRPWGEYPKKPLDVLSGVYTKGAHNQQWSLERRSRSVSEVHDAVDVCPILQDIGIAWPSADVHGMLVIRDAWRDSLFKGTGLMRQFPRPGIMDHKAFAMKIKETVQYHCDRFMKIDGYAILFGVVGGSADLGSKAYNWYLTDDLCEIVFLDPLNGRELTAKGLQKKGFRAEWAIC